MSVFLKDYPAIPIGKIPKVEAKKMLLQNSLVRLVRNVCYDRNATQTLSTLVKIVLVFLVI